MKNKNGPLMVIGENFNATRRIKATSPKIVEEDGKTGVRYTDLDGKVSLLDCTDIIPEDPAERNSFAVPHIAQALRKKDMNYIAWAIKNQEKHGAHIIDVCVDEMSAFPEERFEWIKWTVEVAQKVTDSIISIDSSDSKTIFAGLEAHDSSISRPAINSFNLEDGRQDLVPMAKEHDALLFVNASGNAGMPENAEQRVENLVTCMDMMDEGGIPMEDRYLDPLVFPIGAGPDFGNHYLDAVRELRKLYPEAHLFGGHSNISFGLPQRKLVNDTFISLSILAGCDSVMIDPVMNAPERFEDFMYVVNALTGVDEFSMKYLKHIRAKNNAASGK